MISIRQTAWVEPFAYGQGKLFGRLLADMLNGSRKANARPSCGGEQRITDCVGVDTFHARIRTNRERFGKRHFCGRTKGAPTYSFQARIHERPKKLAIAALFKSGV